MTSNSFVLDKLLTLYLSEGMMAFTGVLLIVSIVTLIRCKGYRRLRSICMIVVIYCALYLGVIFAISCMFGAPHEPAPPTYAVRSYSFIVYLG